MSYAELHKKYPLVFESGGELPWGLECGEGWFDLIDTLCGMIEMQIMYNGAPEITVTQIKEKFGTLRFYYNGGDERIAGMVMMAEAMSAHICETCGAPGKIDKNGWIKTLCPEHSRDR